MPNRTPAPVTRPPRTERRPLLSVCTILILSGFLLGMSAGGQFSGEMRLLVSIAGLSGLVAFVGLDHVSHLRRIQRDRQEQEYFEHRLEKHLENSDSAIIVDPDELAEMAQQATTAKELVTAGSDA